VRFIELLVLLLINHCVFSAVAPATSSTKLKTYLMRHESVSDTRGEFMLAYTFNDGTTTKVKK
ncbi:pupal cuticle protein 20, partial [Aphis craccivora]